MDNLYGGHNNPKTQAIKYFDGNVMPISIGRARFDVPIPLSPVFEPYLSSESPNAPNPMTPLFKCMKSGSSVPFDLTEGGSRGGICSPLASIENMVAQPSRSPLPVFKTPMKVEEDVIVMDGILVKPKGGSSRLKAMQTPSDWGDKNSFYKRDKCLFWEDSGSCRLGSKCQFAHGQEELRPARFTTKGNKSEICKSFNLGSCSYGTKCRFVHHQEPEKEQEQKLVNSAAGPKVGFPVTRTEAKQPASGGNISTSTTVSAAATTSGNTGWSPQDDGIEISLPEKAPSGEDADAYIDHVLYGPSAKRLPVFVEICPE